MPYRFKLYLNVGTKLCCKIKSQKKTLTINLEQHDVNYLITIL